MKLPFKLWSDDKNKKVYRIVHTYQLTVEQYVKANNRDEAFDICLDKGGIIHDKINVVISLSVILKITFLGFSR